MTLAQKRNWQLKGTLYLTMCLILLAFDCHADKPPPTEQTHALIPYARITAPLETVATLGKDNVVVIHHHAQQIDNPALPHHPIQLIQAITTFDAPAERVMAALLDFNAYARYMPHVNSSRIDSHENDTWLAHFRLSFRLPLLDVEPDVWMRYRLLSDTVLSERIERGDLDYAIGLWQLYPLDAKRTLLVHTAWSDFGSASWLLRLAFAAQPDFERLSPVSAAVLSLQSLRQHISEDFLPATVYAPTTATPDALLPDFTPEQVDALATLANTGNVTLVAPLRRIRTPRERGQSPRWLEYQPVTTLGLVNRDRLALQPVYSDLKRYPARIPALRRLKNIEQKDAHLKADWRLGFDFAIFTLNIDFTANGTWSNDAARFDFVSHDGDFRFLFGRWQWLTSGEDQTLVQFSSAHDLNPDTSWLLKAVRDIPHNQLFSGIFIGSQLIEGQRSMLLQSADQ